MWNFGVIFMDTSCKLDLLKYRKMDWNEPERLSMNQYQSVYVPVWTKPDSTQYWLVCTSMNQTDPVLTSMYQYEPDWPSTD